VSCEPGCPWTVRLMFCHLAHHARTAAPTHDPPYAAMETQNAMPGRLLPDVPAQPDNAGVITPDAGGALMSRTLRTRRPGR